MAALDFSPSNVPRSSFLSFGLLGVVLRHSHMLILLDPVGMCKSPQPFRLLAICGSVVWAPESSHFGYLASLPPHV